MPWCPVCKNEYKDGYTLCADCGAELVDCLDEEADSENNSEVLADYNEEVSQEIISEDENGDSKVLADLENFHENTNKRNVHESVKPYVKASERAENYKSSAFALLLVGVLGALFLVLSFFKVIPLNLAANINMLFYIVMGFMFVAFIVMGVKSLKASKTIADTAADEEELTQKVYDFFDENHSSASIDEIAFKDEVTPLSDEEKFFPRSKCIKEIIIATFGELDEAYLTELSETVYSNIFEK